MKDIMETYSLDAIGLIGQDMIKILLTKIQVLGRVRGDDLTFAQSPLFSGMTFLMHTYPGDTAIIPGFYFTGGSGYCPQLRMRVV